MLKTSMSVLMLTAFLCADSAVLAQRGQGWTGGQGYGWGQSSSSYYRGGYGNWGRGNYGNWGSGYYGNYWGRGNQGWPGNWSYYGGTRYYSSPGYYTGNYSGGWYNSPGYAGTYGSATTQSTVPSGQNALAYGDADEAALGVWISQTGPNFRVMGLAANSPAAQAGVRTGDVIHSIDGKQFNTARELIDYVSKKDLNDSVEIGFTRSGQQYAASMPLSARAVAYGLRSQSDVFAGREGGQEYSVMRPATEGGQVQELESEIHSLKQDIHQLRQELHQMHGGEGSETQSFQRSEQFGPPAPPSAESRFDRTQTEIRQGSEVQQSPRSDFNEPFAPPVFPDDEPGLDAQPPRSDSQDDSSRRIIEERQIEQRQFQQRESDRNLDQRDSDRDRDRQKSERSDQQENRTGV